VTAAVRALLVEQVDAGGLVPALDLDVGAEPDTAKATAAIRILLHAKPLPPTRFDT
jgi:hypothetical protein